MLGDDAFATESLTTHLAVGIVIQCGARILGDDAFRNQSLTTRLAVGIVIQSGACVSVSSYTGGRQAPRQPVLQQFLNS